MKDQERFDALVDFAVENAERIILEAMPRTLTILTARVLNKTINTFTPETGNPQHERATNEALRAILTRWLTMIPTQEEPNNFIIDVYAVADHHWDFKGWSYVKDGQQVNAPIYQNLQGLLDYIHNHYDDTRPYQVNLPTMRGAQNADDTTTTNG